MKKYFIVFKFVYLKHVKSKPFIILTLVTALVLGGVLSFPGIKEKFSSDDKEVPADEIMKIGINTNQVYSQEVIHEVFKQSFPDYQVDIVDETTATAETLVEDEEFEFIVLIDDVNSYTLIKQPTGIQDSSRYRIDGILLNYYKSHLLTESGLSEDDATKILGAQMNANVIETGKSQEQSFFYTYVLVGLLYMVIIIYGQLVATSVASEKSSRAMEILITTVSPVKMMFGKVLGTGFAALCQLFVILGSGMLFYNLNASYWGMNEIMASIFNIPVETIIISVILFILGFFVYAFIYAAIGSLANRVEDISTSVLPITFVSVGSFMLVMFSMTSGNVDSTLMKICTWFPLTSPYALLVRVSMTDVMLIEKIGAIAILLVTAIVIGYIAALIYKMGVLLYGKPPKIREIFKLLKKRDIIKKK